MTTANRSRSKWTKHKVMSRDSLLREALPSTRLMTRENFFNMLGRYRSVIVKPTSQWGGKGVMLVSISSVGYCLHAERTRWYYSNREQLWSALRRRMNGSYIVQRRIPLATVDGRPYDLRIMVQRHAGRRDWKVTGRLAKVAGRGYIVTNVDRSSGKIISLAEALRRSKLSLKRSSAVIRRIDRISLRSAKVLQGYYRSIRTVGLDIGLDTNGKIWIVEPNFKPMVGLFKNFGKTYRRIKSYR